MFDEAYASDRLLSAGHGSSGLGEESRDYDANGNTISITDRDGRVREFEYDNLDRQTAEKWKDGGTVIRAISSSYDVKGQLLTRSDPDSSYTYTYDGDGRVLSVDNNGTPNQPRTILVSSYDIQGRRTGLSATVGGTADFSNVYVYDNLDRMTSIRQSGTNVAEKRVDYFYDEDGKLTGILRYRDVDGTLGSGSSGYEYDSADRLTEIAHITGQFVQDQYILDYDVMDRITSLWRCYNDGTRTYSYDFNGQLLSADNEFTPDEGYSYDANGNRTMSGYSTGGDNRLSSDGTYSYQYDGEGNRTLATNTSDNSYILYTYDYRNRLTDVVFKDADGTTTKALHYVYDVNGNRIRRQLDSNGDSTYESEERYEYDGREMVLVYDGSNAFVNRYLQGPGEDQPLAEESSGGMTWLLSDHQGSITLIENDGGWATQWISYDAYGNIASGDPGRFAFTGQAWDADAGVYHYDHRDYDPLTGTFISQDPAQSGNNWYDYVGNDPVNFVDPTGLEAFSSALSSSVSSSWFSPVMSSIAGWASGVGSTVSSWGSTAVSALSDWGGGIASGLGSFASSVGSALGALPSTISGWGGSIGSAIDSGYMAMQSLDWSRVSSSTTESSPQWPSIQLPESAQEPMVQAIRQFAVRSGLDPNTVATDLQVAVMLKEQARIEQEGDPRYPWLTPVNSLGFKGAATTTLDLMREKPTLFQWMERNGGYIPYLEGRQGSPLPTRAEIGQHQQDLFERHWASLNEGIEPPGFWHSLIPWEGQRAWAMYEARTGHGDEKTLLAHAVFGTAEVAPFLAPVAERLAVAGSRSLGALARWADGPAAMRQGVLRLPFGGTAANVEERVYSAYSVAFEHELAPAQFGLSQERHFQIANQALQAERAANPGLAELVPAPTRWGKPPTNWTWQHATIEQGSGRAGVLQLVPRTQHTPSSPFWPLFHPLPGGGGGYAQWAVPAGAPPR